MAGKLERTDWKRLCEHLGIPEYAPLQYDGHHRQEILTYIKSIFRLKTLDERGAELAELDICRGLAQTFSEVPQTPLFKE